MKIETLLIIGAAGVGAYLLYIKNNPLRPGNAGTVQANAAASSASQDTLASFSESINTGNLFGKGGSSVPVIAPANNSVSDLYSTLDPNVSPLSITPTTY